ncbi:hypothetical protein ElyMa_006003300 [Elysia marginata]|uniref:Uncharacterized protein n=1 Tax=Elysia marginata TaxID=1093978 RepID=A0AAV4GFJ7_9GAST|nr:hypothetical protein ElyMa_006003300 [Elysia marginata]
MAAILIWTLILTHTPMVFSTHDIDQNDQKDVQGQPQMERIKDTSCESGARSAAGQSDDTAQSLDESERLLSASAVNIDRNWWSRRTGFKKVVSSERVNYGNDLDPKWAWHHESSSGGRLGISRWVYYFACVLIMHSVCSGFF